jgi:hypothetical protein
MGPSWQSINDSQLKYTIAKQNRRGSFNDIANASVII